VAYKVSSNRYGQLSTTRTALRFGLQLDNRNVPRAEAMQYMADRHEQVVTVFERLGAAVEKKQVASYQNYIDRVKHFLRLDKDARDAECRAPRMSDGPIWQTLGQEDPDVPSERVWHEYHVSFQKEERTQREMLRIQAVADFVVSVEWRNPGHQAEVRL
jgi:hypothetical protein